MGKPDRAIFEHWFSIEAEKPALRFWEEIKPKLVNQITGEASFENVEAIRSALQSADTAYAEMYAAGKRSPARVWAETTHGYRRAAQYLFKPPRSIPMASTSWVDQILSKLSSARGSFYIQRLLERVFSHSLENSSWHSDLFHALDEYYFTDNAQRQHHLVQKAPAAFAALSKSLFDVVPHLQQLSKERDVRSEQTTLLACQRLIHRATVEQLPLLPIQRNAAHKAEQLFVFRMWSANRSFRGVAKPDAIAELMTMEGFQHQFDERTIERMCARFKAAKLKVHEAKLAGAKR